MFELHVNFESVENSKTTESINALLREHAPNSKIDTISTESLVAKIPYRSETNQLLNYTAFISGIEEMARQQQIKSFHVVSSNLENIFNELIVPSTVKKSNTNGHTIHNVIKKFDEASQIVQHEKLTEFEVVKNLVKKRFLHFKRNYRLILCMLIMPTLFEMIAMGFMTLRPPGEHDVNLRFSRALYPNSTDVYSIENGDNVQNETYTQLSTYCANNGDEFGNICKTFDSSEQLFRWVLNI